MTAKFSHPFQNFLWNEATIGEALTGVKAILSLHTVGQERGIYSAGSIKATHAAEISSPVRQWTLLRNKFRAPGRRAGCTKPVVRQFQSHPRPSLWPRLMILPDSGYSNAPRGDCFVASVAWKTCRFNGSAPAQRRGTNKLRP